MISSTKCNENFRTSIEIRDESPTISVRDLLHVVNSDVHIFERGCPIPKLKIPNGLDKKYADYIGESVLNSCIYETSARDGHLNVFIEPISKDGE